MNIFTIIICLLIFIYFVFKKSLSFIQNIFYILQYEKYINVINYYCETSYDHIYKRYILIHSSNGHKPDSKTFETIKRTFIESTIELMGTNNKILFINYFGGYEFLINYLIIFIDNKIENDDILNYVNSLEQQKNNNPTKV